VPFYALSQGLQNAAFSAVLLHVTGRGAAATKYALRGSLGNLPVSYMTAFDGWAHDRFGAAGMLWGGGAIRGRLRRAGSCGTLVERGQNLTPDDESVRFRSTTQKSARFGTQE
jgi:hypothetical protein